QISLAQFTFVGLGAFAMGKVGGGSSPWGVMGALAFGAAAGVIVALPALRLHGLYLALSTLAFAEVMSTIFFNNNAVMGQGGAVHVGRLHLLGISLAGGRSFFVFSAVVFAAAAIGVLAVRRASFGRRLAAMSDSPAACATLGMSLTWTKLAVFSLSAALAALAGVLYGGHQALVGTADFEWLKSLVLLLLAVIWGVDSILGVVFAGLAYALFPTIQEHVPNIHNLQYLAVGLGAIGLGTHPEGVIRQTSARFAELRERRQQRGGEVLPLRERVRAHVAHPRPSTNGDRPAPALELLGIKAA